MSGYYRRNLALAHHLGFGAHAQACAEGVIEALRLVRDRSELVVELGCGSGLLTRHLVDAGHRVIATDASDEMLALARESVPGAVEVRRLTLPDDPIPPADAIVSVGHVLNYLPDESAIDRALVSIAAALRPGGVLALDLCDLRWGEARRSAAPYVRIEDDWVLVTRYSIPVPERFVREITVFVRDRDGAWSRDDERHDNVLLDTSRIPATLARLGVRSTVAASFGQEQLPAGLVAVVGRKEP
jgi:SAM-dependent methyltransferase